MSHLRRLAENLRRDGVLVSDCFSAAAYSLGGRLLGYRAHYYSPGLYRSLLEYCGFGGAAIETVSGRDGINHVMLAEPRAARVTQSRTRERETSPLPTTR